MSGVCTLLFLLNSVHVIVGPRLDLTALTCFVCSSQNLEDCGDPVERDAEQSIPYFECNRLYGVFDDDPSVEYNHFRPTNHGKARSRPSNITHPTTHDRTTEVNITTTKTTTTVETTKMSTNTNSNEEHDYEGFASTTNNSTEGLTAQPRRDWTKPPESQYFFQVFADISEIGNDLWHMISIAHDRLWRNEQSDHQQPQKYAAKANQSKPNYSQFSPFQTQGRPKGLKEKPQHYCYKLIIDDGLRKIVKRGCTNVTTKSRACNDLYKLSNVSLCKFCGLNFCNGIKGTANMNLKMAVGVLIAYGLITNKIAKE